MGNLRLNKVVRGIMSRYCPFAREIRNHLEKHPAHSDAIRLFNAGHEKEAKSLENRYARYRERNGVLLPDLVGNLHFYRDLQGSWMPGQSNSLMRLNHA